MEQYKNLIVDACVLIAKFRGADPPFQQQHTDFFFELVQNHNLKILVVRRALDEAIGKYAFICSSLNDFMEQLKSAGKFGLIENNALQQHLPEIMQLRQKAKRGGFDLSFADVAQIFYAIKIKAPLVSWDAGIIDYCIENGIAAFRPNEFCMDYQQKY